MRPSQALESNRAAIRDIAARHRVRGVRVFGSVVRGTDTDGSDLDLLVEPTEQTTLLDIVLSTSNSLSHGSGAILRAWIGLRFLPATKSRMQ